jgi:hypothetical protein
VQSLLVAVSRPGDPHDLNLATQGESTADRDRQWSRSASTIHAARQLSTGEDHDASLCSGRLLGEDRERAKPEAFEHAMLDRRHG